MLKEHLQEFREDLSNVGRFITYMELFEKFDKKHLYFERILEMSLDNILDKAQEAEGLAFIYLALGLDCKIIQYNFLFDIFVQYFPENMPSGSKIEVSILRDCDQYYSLMKIQEMELECFNLAKMKSDIVKASEVKPYKNILRKETLN